MPKVRHPAAAAAAAHPALDALGGITITGIVAIQIFSLLRMPLHGPFSIDDEDVMNGATARADWLSERLIGTTVIRGVHFLA